MKIRGTVIGWNIAGFFWSIFMGVTAFAVGFGALFPQLDLIAQPLICPNGQLRYQQNVSNPLPGTTYTTVDWYCVDNQSGAMAPLDVLTVGLYAGPFYGLLLFVAVILIELVYTWRNSTAWLFDGGSANGSAASSGRPAEQYDAMISNLNERIAESAQKTRTAGDSLARMKQLDKLRSANMISKAEYDQKRAEILKEV
jgi:hypothetical protein